MIWESIVGNAQKGSMRVGWMEGEGREGGREGRKEGRKEGGREVRRQGKGGRDGEIEKNCMDYW